MDCLCCRQLLEESGDVYGHSCLLILDLAILIFILCCNLMILCDDDWLFLDFSFTCCFDCDAASLCRPLVDP